MKLITNEINHRMFYGPKGFTNVFSFTHRIAADRISIWIGTNVEYYIKNKWYSVVFNCKNGTSK